jgi:hypothetical protein
MKAETIKLNIREVYKMRKAAKDDEREDRITNDIIVDAYDSEERILGWQAYLDDTLQFPFQAKCVKEIAVSPLKKNEKVMVLEMAAPDFCKNGMCAIVQWQDRRLGVPLEQLLPIDSDEETLEAVKDWHYWVEKGYEF